MEQDLWPLRTLGPHLSVVERAAGGHPLRDLPPPLSLSLPECPMPSDRLLAGHSLGRSQGVFFRAGGTSSVPFTHLATMGLC